MRLTCLLLIGFIPFYAFPQPQPPQSYSLNYLLKEHPYDTLDKYSYLIISLDRQAKNGDVATGFFYRKKKKLFLVSAYHLFSGFNVLTKTFSNVRPDVLVVWYKDMSDTFRTEVLSLRRHNRRSRDSIFRLSDVDMMDVSKYFKNGKIYSVEKMMSEGNYYSQVMKGDTVVAYGFPNVSVTTFDSLRKNLTVPPKGYLCMASDTPSNQQSRNSDLPTVYRYIFPPLQKGISGAPIFRVKTESADRKIIEFMGIQSFSSTDSTNSMIVNESEMIKLLRYFKQ